MQHKIKVIDPSDPLHEAVAKLSPQQMRQAFAPTEEELAEIRKAESAEPQIETEADSAGLLKRRYPDRRKLQARLDQPRVSSPSQKPMPKK